MLEMYILHKQSEMNKSNNLNMLNLSNDEIGERRQTFRVLFSTLRTYRDNCKSFDR